MKKIKKICKSIQGGVIEGLSLAIMIGLYCFSQRRFDPKESDIARDNNGKAVQPPILLIHGYLHNSSCWLFHRRGLRKANYLNVFTVDLGAMPNKSIKEYAEVLRQRVQEIQKITKRDDIKFIGHSMGGVVCSYYATNMAEKDRIRVTDVITLSSPLRGTKMHFIGIGQCARELEYESPFIKDLSERIKSATKSRFFHIASGADFLIKPYYSALNLNHEPTNNGKKGYVAPYMGHTTPLFSKEIIAKEIEILNLFSS